jgi:hypothetical protein
MMHPTKVITCTSAWSKGLGDGIKGCTICTTIHLARLPVLELNHAKTSMAMSWSAYPPIGIALISDTPNRKDPSGFLTSFYKISLLLFPFTKDVRERE